MFPSATEAHALPFATTNYEADEHGTLHAVLPSRCVYATGEQTFAMFVKDCHSVSRRIQALHIAGRVAESALHRLYLSTLSHRCPVVWFAPSGRVADKRTIDGFPITGREEPFGGVHYRRSRTGTTER